MRMKKQKRHRKVVRFYTACFGFHEPYKVLCDGTFIHHLLLYGLIPADDALSRLLGARSILFSTTCISAELRALGESHSDAFQASQNLITARCDHEKRVGAAMCIEGVIAEGNPEHFFVATQDADLRKKLREIPGIPVIYGLKNSLFIEKPSSEQHEFVKSAEEKRLHMSEWEAQLLRKRNLKGGLQTQVATESNDAFEGGNDIGTVETIRKQKNARKNLAVVDKVQFKRNRAKGPNPLSCKKKKVKDNSTVAHNQGGGAENATKRKRIRKRIKSKKDANTGEHGN